MKGGTYDLDEYVVTIVVLFCKQGDISAAAEIQGGELSVIEWAPASVMLLPGRVTTLQVSRPG